MIVVNDVLKVISSNPRYKRLQEQLECFSLGTPIRGAGEDMFTKFAKLTFDENTKARMDNGEVVLE